MSPSETSSKTSTLSNHIAKLELGETLEVNQLALKFENRGSRRLVIGFFEAGDNARWLDEPCAEAGFSQLRVQSQTADGFQGTALRTFLTKLAKSDLFKRFPAVSLCGAGSCGAAALACGSAFEDPVIVAFDPVVSRTIPAPKNRRSAYLFFDPFSQTHIENVARIKGPHIHRLKCFGLQTGCLNALWRMKILPTLLVAALRDELDPNLFYSLIRRRKDYVFYRKGMETALQDRGQDRRRSQFRAAFRSRRSRAGQEAQFEELKTHAAENHPERPGAWVRAGGAGVENNWPSAGGNIWMLDNSGGRMRYLSDRWEHMTIGYEERAGITLAQTPPVALGVVGFGQGLQVERPLPRRFRWHVTDETLDGTGPALGPLAEATIQSEMLYAKRQTQPSILAISQPQAGTVTQDAAPGAAPYQALLSKVKKACASLGDWDKSLHIDRVRLGLLAGAPQTQETDAASHYSQTATQITKDLSALTGQSAPPFIVVIQSAGFRHDGCSEVILAEGQFDLDNPALTALVPTPAYPWPLMAGTPASPSPEAALIMDELCVLALTERQNGRPWHCPALHRATVSGRVVTAQFSSMDGLHLEEGRPHGFRLETGAATPQIVKVEVISDNEIRLELDSEIVGSGGRLAYAWGHETSDPHGSHSANHGALRDRWSQPSIALPEQTLYRYALSGRVPLILRG